MLKMLYFIAHWKYQQIVWIKGFVSKIYTKIDTFLIREKIISNFIRFLKIFNSYCLAKFGIRISCPNKKKRVENSIAEINEVLRKVHTDLICLTRTPITNIQHI